MADINIRTMDAVLRLTGWNGPAGLPAKVSDNGRFRIARLRGAKGLYRAHNTIPGVRYFDMPVHRFTALEEWRDGAWQVWMTDEPLHWFSMRQLAQMSHGRVLVGGLGLGMIVKHLRQQPQVGDVLVSERAPEVIELVWPHVQWKRGAHLVQGDFFEVYWGADQFDTVITDFWVGQWDDPELQALFLRTFEHVNQHWPNALQLYHGLQPLADHMHALLALRHDGVPMYTPAEAHVVAQRLCYQGGAFADGRE